MAEKPGNPIVLYDGVCTLCESTVQRIIRNDRAGLFRFASLQSKAGQRLLERYSYQHEALSSVLLIDDGVLYRKSRAALRIARYMEGPWRALYFLLAWVPSPILDPVYDFIGKRRYRWFGRKDRCGVPADTLPGRFLDDGEF